MRYIHARGHRFVLPTEAIRRTLHARNAQHVRQYPFMNPSVFESINETLPSLHLQAPVWDNQPCKLQATCSVQFQGAMAELMVCDPNFRIMRHLSKAMGRCLTLLLKELHTTFPTGVPRLCTVCAMCGCTGITTRRNGCIFGKGILIMPIGN